MLIHALSRSPEETRQLGARLAARLAPDGALLLEGDLGAGKTVLVQGLAAGLGIAPEEVQSPTFTLWREHFGAAGGGAGTSRLVHVDLYRLEPGEIVGLGLEELLAGRGVKAVEWAERLPFPVPNAVRLRLRRLGGEAREIRELAEGFELDLTAKEEGAR